MVYKYNNKYRHYSRMNKSNQTKAEKLLWFHLRNRGLEGYKFHRQFPIHKYILDFYCDEKKLAIELDGGQHNGSMYDKNRDSYLRKLEIKTLRFWDNDVLQNINGVLESIILELNNKNDLTLTLS